ncbi:polysaccharide export protein [Ramlibacter sp. USB13]|uniref:Polysaccharide export protein n=1 Tax=Ramlibacter cellulosilyticus TaxID=2764187 RepID=A0A923MUQ5_9BURK|nr:polysaccharide biosynthesis/export family protein [Ramlibacter cellulosilyticus]MBC5785618.1 polysaccharide export protein [Ramlibacter cellulosilyticus]
MRARPAFRILLPFLALALAGCASPFLPREGPSTDAILEAPNAEPSRGIQVLDVTPELARKARASRQQRLFSGTWGETQKPGFRIGAGDVLEVTVWEAPPASLFASTLLDPRSTASTARASVLPEQMVSNAGDINVPFVGQVRAAGRELRAIEDDIARGLRDKANQPQVMVRVLRNTTSTVTVVGEVNNSLRMPLTAQGERLLDALAAAGGTRQPVGKMQLQVTRGSQVLALPLDQIIADPRQNIVLQPGDVVTALHQPFSLTVLGATGKNEELAFEGQGLTLAQALGRAGGLQDYRSDATGVFIFRFEDPAVVPRQLDAPTDADGRAPVVYKVDLRDPASFFAAQDFPMRHRDVLYVATAKGAELQKFLNIISSIVLPTATVRALGQ